MQILKQTKDWIAVYKPEGKTPLECIRGLKNELSETASESMAYAGRLDPMAEGVLLILRSEACKERDKYLGTDKEYVFEVLLGLQSDTHDVLGLVSPGDTAKLAAYDAPTLTQAVHKILDTLLGTQEFAYPVFSSKTVEGKPLFLWALEGRVDDITVPTRKVEIYELEILKLSKHTLSDIMSQVPPRIAKVTPVCETSKALGADFRRSQVLDSWDALGQEIDSDSELVSIQIRARVSSGTYMRTLARRIGEELGTQGLAWRIQRRAIYPYIELSNQDLR